MAAILNFTIKKRTSKRSDLEWVGFPSFGIRASTVHWGPKYRTLEYKNRSKNKCFGNLFFERKKENLGPVAIWKPDFLDILGLVFRCHLNTIIKKSDQSCDFQTILKLDIVHGLFFNVKDFLMYIKGLVFFTNISGIINSHYKGEKTKCWSNLTFWNKTVFAELFLG